MIYLASPHSHPDPLVREQRYLSALRATQHLLAKKEWAYSPIVHNHVIAQLGDLPNGFEFWQEFDLHMIDLASKVVVLRIDGWEASKGIKAEVEYATSLGKSVEYL